MTRLHQEKDLQFRSFQLWYTNLTNTLQAENNNLKQQEQKAEANFRESFLERMVVQLRSELEIYESKLLKYEKCALPLNLTRDCFEIASNDRCLENVALLVGEYLIEAFGREDNLYSICNHVTKELARSQGGHWLCTVWPYDVEVGLGINDYSMFLALDFKNSNLDYRIIVAKTSQSRSDPSDDQM